MKKKITQTLTRQKRTVQRYLSYFLKLRIFPPVSTEAEKFADESFEIFIFSRPRIPGAPFFYTILCIFLCAFFRYVRRTEHGQ